MDSPGLFSCALSDALSIKALSKLFMCATKIAESVAFSGTREKLYIRGLNPARSASVEFTLNRGFFDEMKVEEKLKTRGETEEEVHVIVGTRTLQQVSRNPGVIKSLKISFTHQADVLNLEILMKNEVKKVFQIPCEDGEVLRAVCSTDLCTCNATVRPRFLTEILSRNFHLRLEEIKIVCSAKEFRLVSFVQDMPDEDMMNAMLRTEIVVESKEFEEYFLPKVDPVELTFSFRAFKSVLDLTESLDAPLRLFFEKPGFPIILNVSFPERAHPTFEAQFILATRQVLSASVGSSRTDLESTATPVNRPRQTTPSENRTTSAATVPDVSLTQNQRLGTSSIDSFLTRKEPGHRAEDVMNGERSRDENPHRSETLPKPTEAADIYEEDEFVEGTPPPPE